MFCLQYIIAKDCRLINTFCPDIVHYSVNAFAYCCRANPLSAMYCTLHYCAWVLGCSNLSQ